MGILANVQRELIAHIRAAGFEPIDQELRGEVGWLEYRRADAAGAVLISVTHTAPYRTVTAELWRPARLGEALRAEPPEDVADRRGVWQYRTPAGEHDLEQDVAATVAAWLADLRGQATGGRDDAEAALVR